MPQMDNTQLDNIRRSLVYLFAGVGTTGMGTVWVVGDGEVIGAGTVAGAGAVTGAEVETATSSL
jgi:hypothetical protein